MWRVTWKGIWAKRGRFVLTSVAVMLGVAFVSGTLVLTATISNTFDGLFSQIYEHTDAVVREQAAFEGTFGAQRGRIDASLLETVRSARGVERAYGNVTGIAVIVDRQNDALGSNGRGAPSLGFAYVPDRELSSLQIVEGRGPRAADEIVIDKSSADAAGYRPGATVPVITKAGRDDYRLTGIVKFGTADSPLGATIVAFAPDTASRVLATPGTFDAIDVKADPGVSQEQVVRAIRVTLRDVPAAQNVEVLSGAAITAEAQNDLKDNLKFFNTFLLVFGVVALLVGSFIIFNTFSIIVAQRGREMALLRAIGAGRKQVLTSVLTEATLVGLVASTLGFAGGILLAGGLKALLGALGIDIPASALAIPASAVIWSFVTGMVVTVSAAAFPAWRAARIPPIAALRTVSIDRSGSSTGRAVSGIVVTALGVALLLLGLFGSGGNALPSVGGGMVIVFVGVAILGPMIAGRLSGWLGAPLPRLRGVTGTIARANAMRNPRRTSATAASLMIGVALVGLITIFAASAQASIGAAIDESMKADYVVSTGSFQQGAIPIAAEEQLATTPGVESVSGVRTGAAKVGGSVVDLVAVDPDRVGSLFDLHVTQGSIENLGTTGLAVLDTVARDKGLHVGSTVTAEFPATGVQQFRVEAVFEQALFTQYVTSLAAYEANYPDQFDAQIYLKTAGGASAANRRAIEGVLRQYPDAKLEDRAEYKQSQSAEIQSLLNLIYVLLFFAIVIALFGIANTLGLSIIERTHELGLLRAVGMSRRQLRSSIRWESVLIALLGTLLGLVIGTAFAWAIVRALHDDGIDHFSTAPLQLVMIVVLASIFGVVAAAWPARRAARLDILRAIQSE